MLTIVQEHAPYRAARGHVDARRIRQTKMLMCRFDDLTFQQIIRRADENGEPAAAIVRRLVAKGLGR
jgi:hypothetical protein